jgi:hypothetical protein
MAEDSFSGMDVVYASLGDKASDCDEVWMQDLTEGTVNGLWVDTDYMIGEPFGWLVKGGARKRLIRHRDYVQQMLPVALALVDHIGLEDSQDPVLTTRLQEFQLRVRDRAKVDTGSHSYNSSLWTPEESELADSLYRLHRSASICEKEDEERSRIIASAGASENPEHDEHSAPA